MPSPFVSRYAVRFGGCMTYTVRPSDATPRGLSISANVVYVSARPSSSESTSRITRPTPLSVESERFGSTQTNTAPSGDSPTQVGYIATGGPAKSVAWNPSGALKAVWSFASAAGSRGTAPLFGMGLGRAVFGGGPCAASGASGRSVSASSATTRARSAARGRKCDIMMSGARERRLMRIGGVSATRRRIRLDVVALVVRGLRIHAPLEIQEPHVPEVDRVAFGLERDEARREQLPLDELLRIVAGHDAAGLTRARRSEERRVGKEWRARGAPY